VTEFLPYAAFGLSAVATGISAFVAIRAGRWRNAEGHAALVGRVGALESGARLVAQRLDALEQDVGELPTKADFTRLEGEIKTTCAIAERTEKSVTRIEDFLLERRP
jgi:hypothetical protein